MSEVRLFAPVPFRGRRIDVEMDDARLRGDAGGVDSHLAAAALLGEGDREIANDRRTWRTRTAGGRVEAELRPPTALRMGHGTLTVSVAHVMSALALDSSHLLQGHEPVVVGVGGTYMVIPLASRDAMRAIALDEAALTNVRNALDLAGFATFTRPGLVARHDGVVRVFGDHETLGVAAAGAYMRFELGIGEGALHLETHLDDPAQGSSVHVRFEETAGRPRIWVGGRARAL